MKRTREESSRIGRENQYEGASFEAWIHAQNEMAMLLGLLAHVAKNEPVSKVLGGRVVYTGRGVADYTGTLHGGLSLAAEAKSTAKDTLPRSVVKTKQAEHLDLVARAGGLAILLFEDRREQGRERRYAIPWADVPWRKHGPGESLAPEAVASWLITPGSDTCYLTRFASRYIPGGPAPGGTYRMRPERVIHQDW